MNEVNLINFNEIKNYDNIIYINFWGGFNEATDNKLKKIFNYLFSEINKDIVIISIFGKLESVVKYIDKPNTILVSFSGENFSLLLKDKNDINLVMESKRSDMNIIPRHTKSMCFLIHSTSPRR